MYVLKIGGLPIRGGARYEWRLLIDGETQDDWRLAFNTASTLLRPAELAADEGVSRPLMRAWLAS
jgi:hypothetical protein